MPPPPPPPWCHHSKWLTISQEISWNFECYWQASIVWEILTWFETSDNPLCNLVFIWPVRVKHKWYVYLKQSQNRSRKSLCLWLFRKVSHCIAKHLCLVWVVLLEDQCGFPFLRGIPRRPSDSPHKAKVQLASFFITMFMWRHCKVHVLNAFEYHHKQHGFITLVACFIFKPSYKFFSDEKYKKESA